MYELMFHVIDKRSESLIGLQCSLDLNIVTVNNVDLLQPCRSKLVKPNQLQIVTKEYVGEHYKDLFNGDLG